MLELFLLNNLNVNCQTFLFFYIQILRKNYVVLSGNSDDLLLLK